MLENFLKASLDNDVINNYLRLLALRQVQLENQVERLNAEIQRQNFQQAELALLRKEQLQPLPLMESMTVEPELMARLLGYLPAIFPQFWKRVSPNELAQLLGLKEKPMIPSPFYYPNNTAIVHIMEHIKALPHQEQIVIEDICRHLKKRYNLPLHPISNFWFNKFNQDPIEIVVE